MTTLSKLFQKFLIAPFALLLLFPAYATEFVYEANAAGCELAIKFNNVIGGKAIWAGAVPGAGERVQAVVNYTNCTGKVVIKINKNGAQDKVGEKVIATAGQPNVLKTGQFVLDYTFPEADKDYQAFARVDKTEPEQQDANIHPGEVATLPLHTSTTNCRFEFSLSASPKQVQTANQEILLTATARQTQTNCGAFTADVTFNYSGGGSEARTLGNVQKWNATGSGVRSQTFTHKTSFNDLDQTVNGGAATFGAIFKPSTSGQDINGGVQTVHAAPGVIGGKTPPPGGGSPNGGGPNAGGGGGSGGNNGGNAGGRVPGPVETIRTPISIENLGQLISTAIRTLLIGAAAFSVLFIMIGGFRMIVSSGNEQQVEAGKKTVTWAVIGLVVTVLAFTLVSILQSILGRK